MEGFFWILFFVVIAVLKGLAWFTENLKGPANRRQAPPPRSAGGRRPPAGETPFQAMLRMLEEAMWRLRNSEEVPQRARQWASFDRSVLIRSCRRVPNYQRYIESIEVLTGAADTTRYGIRGGNGVIVIKTKQSGQ